VTSFTPCYSELYRFGDTVNVASRMESTSKKGKIQVSMATAHLLRDAGKGHWVVPREDKVLAKGIGVVQTCWPHAKSERNSMSETDSSEHEVASTGHTDGDFSGDKQAGTGDWLTKSLAQFLKVVVAQQRRIQEPEDNETTLSETEQMILRSAKAPIEELAYTIAFPAVHNLEAVQEEAELIDLGPLVMTQLRNFVWAIAVTYVLVVLTPHTVIDYNAPGSMLLDEPALSPHHPPFYAGTNKCRSIISNMQVTS
jgi:hypothetical protein